MLITAEKRIKENTHVYNASVKYGIKFLFLAKMLGQVDLYF
jgi:hypothetical protein